MDIGQCVICCESIDQTSISAVRCGHIFHLQCINTWLGRDGRCPICKVPTGPQDIIPRLFLAGGSNTSSSSTSQEMEGLRDEVKALRNALKDAQLALQSQANDMADQKTQLALSEAKRKRLQGNLTDLQSSNAELEFKLRTATGQLQRAEKAKTSLKKTVDELKKQPSGT